MADGRDKLSQTLIKLFNKRDSAAFEQVYTLLYNELFYFADQLFSHDESLAEDTLQDVFVKVWSNTARFMDETHLKGYLYLSIRNAYKNMLNHRDTVERYRSLCRENAQFVDAFMTEAETLSLISASMALLPEQCAQVFRLFVEGWSAEEISQKLGKSINTVYSQKQTAVKILRSKLDKDKFLLLTQLF